MSKRKLPEPSIEEALLSFLGTITKAKDLLKPDYASKVHTLMMITLDYAGLIAPACSMIDHYFADPKYRKEATP